MNHWKVKFVVTHADYDSVDSITVVTGSVVVDAYDIENAITVTKERLSLMNFDVISIKSAKELTHRPYCA